MDEGGGPANWVVAFGLICAVAITAIGVLGPQMARVDVTVAGLPIQSEDWPDASNTGVPDGTSLTTYSTPCTITANNVTLDARDITCSELLIQGTNTTVTRSTANLVTVDESDPTASLSMSESEIDGGTANQGSIRGINFTLDEVEIVGGQHSVHCEGTTGASGNCSVSNSWLHDQYLGPTSGNHENAYISNGGTGHTLIHNTLACTPEPNESDGGCSADVSLFGDFFAITDAHIENNLFVANDGASWCLFGGSTESKPFPDATDVIVTDNTFERGTNDLCGAFGPVTDFDDAGSGNVWTGNIWSPDGDPVPAP